MASFILLMLGEELQLTIFFNYFFSPSPEMLKTTSQKTELGNPGLNLADGIHKSLHAGG